MDNGSVVKNGTHEEESICVGQEEADLHKHCTTCTKNREHKDFIQVDRFTINDLPQDYREIKLFELIKLQVELTVRLTVTVEKKSTSKVIPGFKPNLSPTDDQESKLQVGTGHVIGVDISDINPSLAEIRIHSAAHLFNKQPHYAQIKCDFFFDRGGKPELCHGVVSKELSIKRFNEARDFCVMKVNVKDPALIQRLQNAIKNYKLLEKHVHEWYDNNRNSIISIHESDLEKRLCVIVSHPHGCSKMISVGFCISRNVFYDTFCSQLKYTTSTCNGSSGADIFVLGLTRNDHQHLHAGASEDNTCNYSAEGLDLRYYIQRIISPNCSPEKDNLWSVVARRIYQQASGDYGRLSLMNDLNEECNCGGSWEIVPVHGGEIEVQRIYNECEKKLYHQNYIILPEFNKNNLPFVHDGKEVFDFIKLTSHLTVRVTVKSVSHREISELRDCQGNLIESPDFDIHDPRCSDSTINMMIAGTGFINRVSKNNDKTKSCMCKECQDSGTLTTEFAQIHVLTTFKVVSDKSEGKESSCDLFFDSGSTPDDCSDAVTLSGAQRAPAESGELCYLIYYTHDLDLADRLQEMLSKREDLKNELKKSCRNMSDFSKKPPAAIVFHPHGCGKRVSFGKCMSRSEYKIAPLGFSHLSYDVSTCPGATGAQVVFLHSDMLDRTVVHLEKCPLNNSFNHCVLI